MLIACKLVFKYLTTVTVERR